MANYAETMDRLKASKSEEDYDSIFASVAERLLKNGDEESAACIDRLVFDQKDYRRLLRKADHGCWNAYCRECDKK